MGNKMRSLAFIFIGLLFSCRHGSGAGGQTPISSASEPVSLEYFSESDPVSAVALHAGGVYIGSVKGLMRYDLRQQRWQKLGAAESVPAGAVYALAAGARGGIWGAAAEGLFLYGASEVRRLALAGVSTQQITSLLPDKDGMWIGTSKGVARLIGSQATWLLSGRPVKSLIADLDGSGWWAAVEGRGLYQWRAGKVTAHDKRRGMLITRPVSMNFGNDGALLVLGEGEGQDYFSCFDGQHWSNYSLPGRGQAGWIAEVQGRVLFSYGRRVYRLLRLDEPAAERRRASANLAAGPLTLGEPQAPAASSDYPSPFYYTEAGGEDLPAKITSLASNGRHLVLGTPMQGAVYFDGVKARWLHTPQLVGAGGLRLRLACAGGVCILINHEGAAFGFSDGKFSPVRLELPPGHRAQTVLLDGKRQLVLIASSDQDRKLTFLRPSGKSWQAFLSTPLILPPGSRAQVRFARQSPEGEFWVGLAYSERADEEAHPWGVMVLSASGVARHHRSSLVPDEERAPSSLALPDDLRDVYFWGAEIWLATAVGVCRIKGGNVVDLFSENEGLESENVFALARAQDGSIFAATPAGVARFDGQQKWTPLEGGPVGSVHSLLVEGDSLWVGKNEALSKYRLKNFSSSEQHFVVRGGALDLIRDAEQRLWILTEDGLALLRVNP